MGDNNNNINVDRIHDGESYEMILKPRLVKTKMFLCFGERVESGDGKILQTQLGRKELDVEEWVTVGLAIHQYVDEIDKRYHWRISHMESGRAILRHMRNREQAIEYLMRVREIQKNWTFGKIQQVIRDKV